MKKNNFFSYFILALVLIACVGFVIYQAGPNLLRLYVRLGIGISEHQPLFCLAPGQEVIRGEVDQAYKNELKPYVYADMQFLAPKEFTIVKEIIKRYYYKKHRRQEHGGNIYILHEPPGYFINLFPDITKMGVNDDYDFFTRTMNAKTIEISNFTDAFFTIIKSLFTPYLGDQKNLKMARFVISNKRGFITYNLCKEGNFYDCNVFINDAGDYFKVYIKDTSKLLDLNKVFTIVSTVRTAEQR
jgi:hypothetical protein